MNPYQSYMQKLASEPGDSIEKEAFLGGLLGGIGRGLMRAPGAIGRGAMSFVNHPVGRAALVAGAPLAIGAGHAMLDRFKAERTFSEILPRLKAELGIQDENLLRRVFMTVAQASPAVASNPMLAYTAMVQWYGTSGGGGSHFDLNSFSQLQGIQNAHNNLRGGFRQGYDFQSKAIGNIYPSEKFRGFN